MDAANIQNYFEAKSGLFENKLGSSSRQMNKKPHLVYFVSFFRTDFR